MTAFGSSPRLRGTRVRRIGKGSESRFIPASAGNSPACNRDGNALAVHPRVCGELIKVRTYPQGTLGSSPRLRGTRMPELREPIQRRFIPASAGNSVAMRCGG